MKRIVTLTLALGLMFGTFSLQADDTKDATDNAPKQPVAEKIVKPTITARVIRAEKLTPAKPVRQADPVRAEGQVQRIGNAHAIAVIRAEGKSMDGEGQKVEIRSWGNPQVLRNDQDRKFMLGGSARQIEDVLKKGQWSAITPSQGAPYGVWNAAHVIGIIMTPVSPELRAHVDLPKSAGLMIRSVGDGSPAAKAGLKPFDIITRVGDRLVTSNVVLVEMVKKADGKPMTLTIVRSGKPLEVKVTPEERKPAQRIHPDVQFFSRPLTDRDQPNAISRIIINGKEHTLPAPRPSVTKVMPQQAKAVQATAVPRPNIELAKQLEAIQRQLKAMQQQVNELKEK